MTQRETLRELLRPIEELPDEAPPLPSGAAGRQLFVAPRRPCRQHDERPVPPVGRHAVAGLPPPRQKFPAGMRAIPLAETDAEARALRR
jgi:hypothetical protein